MADAITILKKKEAADLAATETELAEIIDTPRRAISESKGEMAKDHATISHCQVEIPRSRNAPASGMRACDDKLHNLKKTWR